MNPKRRNVIFLSLLLLLFLASLVAWRLLRAQPGEQLYVSPQGTGQSCRRSAPCSLAIAQQQVRGLLQESTGPITIYLRGGQYFLEAGLLFGPADSGTPKHPVTYTAYGKEQPHLSAGRLVTGWTSAGNGLYQAQVHDLTFRQVYVNDRRAVRARTPNLEEGDTFGPYLRIRRWQGASNLVVEASQLSGWKDLTGVELVIKKHWNQSRLRIDQVTFTGDTAELSFMQPESDIEAGVQFPPKGDQQTYYLENSFEFLDAPGEWYLDEAAGILYYLPRSGEDLSQLQVIVPVLEQVVILEGAHDIRFQGLSFEHTTWLMPDSQRVGIQAGLVAGSWAFLPGGVRLTASHHIQFVGCVFQHLGAMGVEFTHSTHDNLIADSSFTDIASNGITICTSSEPSAPEERQCRDETLRGNTVSRVAQDYTGGVGIAVIYARGITIERNQVYDLPYTGISVGWGWTQEPTVLQGNLVRENEIYRVMQLHDDGAGIYTLSRQPGTRLVENHIHDLRRSPWAEDYPIAAIYLDEQTTGVVVELNTYENVVEPFNFNRIGVNTIIAVNKDGEQVEFTVP